ncbi:unnamed protein product, partial [Pleuronectes platessa]
ISDQSWSFNMKVMELLPVCFLSAGEGPTSEQLLLVNPRQTHNWDKYETRKYSLEVQPGSTAWKYSLEVQPGSIAWKYCLEVQPGSTAWKYSQEYSLEYSLEVLPGSTARKFQGFKTPSVWRRLRSAALGPAVSSKVKPAAPSGLTLGRTPANDGWDI